VPQVNDYEFDTNSLKFGKIYVKPSQTAQLSQNLLPILKKYQKDFVSLFNDKMELEMDVPKKYKYSSL